MGRRVGSVVCPGDHDFSVIDLGAGMARLGCRRCDTVIVDLDAAKDGASPVSAPGLFGPAKPTIFSVLGEASRAAAASADEERSPRHIPKFAFGGSAPRR